MQYSKTYLFVIALTTLASYLGIQLPPEDAEKVISVLVAIALGLGALYSRYQAGGVSTLGVKK